jgi:hypothetical protein
MHACKADLQRYVEKQKQKTHVRQAGGPEACQRRNTHLRRLAAARREAAEWGRRASSWAGAAVGRRASSQQASGAAQGPRERRRRRLLHGHAAAPPPELPELSELPHQQRAACRHTPRCQRCIEHCGSKPRNSYSITPPSRINGAAPNYMYDCVRTFPAGLHPSQHLDNNWRQAHATQADLAELRTIDSIQTTR